MEEYQFAVEKENGVILLFNFYPRSTEIVAITFLLSAIVLLMYFKIIYLVRHTKLEIKTSRHKNKNLKMKANNQKVTFPTPQLFTGFVVT